MSKFAKTTDVKTFYGHLKSYVDFFDSDTSVADCIKFIATEFCDYVLINQDLELSDEVRERIYWTALSLYTNDCISEYQLNKLSVFRTTKFSRFLQQLIDEGSEEQPCDTRSECSGVDSDPEFQKYTMSTINGHHIGIDIRIQANSFGNLGEIISKTHCSRNRCILFVRKPESRYEVVRGDFILCVDVESGRCFPYKKHTIINNALQNCRGESRSYMTERILPSTFDKLIKYKKYLPVTFYFNYEGITRSVVLIKVSKTCAKFGIYDFNVDLEVFLDNL